MTRHLLQVAQYIRQSVLLVCCGVAWRGVEWCVVICDGMVWNGVVRCGVAGCGVMWLVVAWCGETVMTM